MKKIVERCENQIVLEPLRQYLEQEGIPSEITYEWIGNRGSHGDAILTVEAEMYERALAALGEIDKYGIDDGQALRDASGRSYGEKRAIYDKIGKYAARGLLIVVILVLICGLIKYPPFM